MNHNIILLVILKITMCDTSSHYKLPHLIFTYMYIRVPGSAKELYEIVAM